MRIARPTRLAPAAIAFLSLAGCHPTSPAGGGASPSDGLPRDRYQRWIWGGGQEMNALLRGLSTLGFRPGGHPQTVGGKRIYWRRNNDGSQSGVYILASQVSQSGNEWGTRATRYAIGIIRMDRRGAWLKTERGDRGDVDRLVRIVREQGHR